MSEKDNAAPDPTEDPRGLPWDEITNALSNQKLQSRGWARFPPANIDAARSCPDCQRPPAALAWVFYVNGPECWEAGRGREGWIVACLHCNKQADFIITTRS
jgi:hypothetical protein